MHAAAGNPSPAHIAEAIGLILSPPKYRIATGTVRSWITGPSIPREYEPFRAALDYLESLASQRVNPILAADLRGACEKQWVLAYAKRDSGRDGGPQNASMPAADEVVAVVIDTAQWAAILLGPNLAASAIWDGIKRLLRSSRREEKSLSREEAILLAEAAVHIHCSDLGIAHPADWLLAHDEYQTDDGRWIVRILDEATRRRFFVRIPPGRPTENDVQVQVFAPAQPMSAHREWSFMKRLGRGRR